MLSRLLLGIGDSVVLLRSEPFKLKKSSGEIGRGALKAWAGANMLGSNDKASTALDNTAQLLRRFITVFVLATGQSHGARKASFRRSYDQQMGI